MNPLISAQSLAAWCASDGASPLILHIDDGPDRLVTRRFHDAHVPGARFVNLQRDLVGCSLPGQGRRPLPALDELLQRLSMLGVGAVSDVVVYDPGGMFAGRAWWTLRWAGISRVRLLDGGLQQWLTEGFAVERGQDTTQTPAAKPVSLQPGSMEILKTDEILTFVGEGVLLDARPTAQYLGEAASVLDAELALGHIPGAVNVPAADLFAPGSATLRTRNQLVELFSTTQALLGDRPVGVYCGGGVAGALEVLVLESLGIEASLYVGSWSAWGSIAHLPIQVGPIP